MYVDKPGDTDWEVGQPGVDAEEVITILNAHTQ